MVFNINRFSQNIAENGYLSSTDFIVTIATPPALQRKLLTTNNGRQIRNEDQSRVMSFRIDQQAVPGMSLETAFINKYGVGIPQFMPVNARNREWGFSILLDKNCELWRYWHTWLREVYQFNGSSGSTLNSRNQFASYEAGYKDDYSTIIQISLFEHVGDEVQKIILQEAFPVAIRDVPMGWGDQNNLVKLNVSIAYTEYTIENVAQIERNQAPGTKNGSNTESRVF